MSKHETIIQWIKILLACAAIGYFAFKVGQVIDLLTWIAENN